MTAESRPGVIAFPGLGKFSLTPFFLQGRPVCCVSMVLPHAGGWSPWQADLVVFKPARFRTSDLCG